MPIKVVFTKDAVMHTHDGEIAFQAKAGDVMSLREDQAERWVRRQMAEVFDAAVHDAPKAKAKDAAQTAGGKAE